MAKTVKMCDMPLSIATQVLEMLNPGTVKVSRSELGTTLTTSIEPKYLTYPEGWYYAKGCFRNKHTSTQGVYEEAVMLDPSGNPWCDTATYCTLQN